MANIYRNDLFQKMLKHAQEFLATEASSNLDAVATFAFSDDLPPSMTQMPTCESPIEAGFEVWWYAVDQAENMNWTYYDLHLQLERQHAVTVKGKAYRLDFRVMPDGADPFVGDKAQAGLNVPLPRIAVELDGHDFHEKTKEQVELRNRRDRDLLQDGWLVFHYSGSELVRHPQRCVEEVRRAALSRYHDFASDLIRARETNAC